jgi:hypothetical protein
MAFRSAGIASEQDLKGLHEGRTEAPLMQYPTRNVAQSAIFVSECVVAFTFRWRSWPS